MKKFLIAFSLSFVLFLGGFILRAHDNPLSSISQDELDHPAFSVLPCDDGFFFGYKIKEEWTLRQLAYMAETHVEIGIGEGIDLKDKVVILAIEGTRENASLAVDFKQNVVELREDFPRDKFRMRTWEGEPLVILQYLSDGIPGHPKIKKGNRTEETFPPAMPCGPKQES